MGRRFVCDNGVLAGDFFARVAFKHMHDGADVERWKDIVCQGLSVLEHSEESLERFVDGLRLLKRRRMTDEHLRNIWTRVPTLGDSVLGKIMSRYVEHEELTLYGFLNAGTNVFWHNAKMKSADFVNTDVFATALLEYAFENLN